MAESKLPRGFKTEAERISEAIRAELNLTVHDRLDPFALATHYGVPVHSLYDAAQWGLSSQSVTCLQRPDTHYSALTVCDGERRLIVYNPAHSSARTANDIVHELSHIFRNHPPRPAIGPGGCREWDDRYEEEASWLAGALLVPKIGALFLLRGGSTLEAGAAHFGVTIDLFRWRANVTGVTRRIGYRRTG